LKLANDGALSVKHRRAELGGSIVPSSEMQSPVHHEKSQLICERPTVIDPLPLGLFDRDHDIATGMIAIRKGHDIGRLRNSHEPVMESGQMLVVREDECHSPLDFQRFTIERETTKLTELCSVN
jgi:hypothetical protein